MRNETGTMTPNWYLRLNGKKNNRNDVEVTILFEKVYFVNFTHRKTSTTKKSKNEYN